LIALVGSWDPALRATATDTGACVAERLRVAATHWTRLRGLLGTRELPMGDGLWIKPCRQVHMFGMHYPIDVVFLDDANRVVGLTERLRPWRVSPLVKTAASVIELPAGTIAQAGLTTGQPITIAARTPSAG
jgi:uncharacterized membrane protein (UPF0127 family)